MRNKFLYTIALVFMLASCRKVNVDFSYEPASPNAGEKVEFTNLSTGGEEWVWDFGNNKTATTTSSSIVYEQAGTYLVTLREAKSGKQCIKSIEVDSPEPYLYCTQDEIYMFKPVILKIKTYNPYDHFLAFEWFSNSGMRIISNSFDTDSVEVIFTKAGEVTVEADVMTDEELTNLSETFTVIKTPAPALLMQTSDDKRYFQRFYGEYMEDMRELDYERGQGILDTTKQQLTATDPMERKVYTGSTDGLTVSNSDGGQQVRIAEGNIRTIAVSTALNRIFFATSNGVYSLPLIHTYNNLTDQEPQRINYVSNISRINIDNTSF